jgi:hypothetical protein
MPCAILSALVPIESLAEDIPLSISTGLELTAKVETARASKVDSTTILIIVLWVAWVGVCMYWMDGWNE